MFSVRPTQAPVYLIKKSPTFDAASVRLPERMTDGSVGYDVVSPATVTVRAGDVATVDLGFAMCPEDPHGVGNYPQIHSRSSFATRGRLALGGVIDRDSTGYLKVILSNFGSDDITIAAGDRIAQIVFTNYEHHIQFKEVDALPITARGEGAFGSTGSCGRATEGPERSYASLKADLPEACLSPLEYRLLLAEAQLEELRQRLAHLEEGTVRKPLKRKGARVKTRGTSANKSEMRDVQLVNSSSSELRAGSSEVKSKARGKAHNMHAKLQAVLKEYLSRLHGRKIKLAKRTPHKRLEKRATEAYESSSFKEFVTTERRLKCFHGLRHLPGLRQAVVSSTVHHIMKTSTDGYAILR